MLAKRFFIAGSIGMFLSRIAHMFGQFSFSGGPPQGQEAAVEAQMKALTVSGMGMTFSLWGVMQCWGVFFGVLAVFAGAQNLLLLLGPVSRDPA
jgi:hypothetical protein